MSLRNIIWPKFVFFKIVINVNLSVVAATRFMAEDNAMHRSCPIKGDRLVDGNLNYKLKGDCYY